MNAYHLLVVADDPLTRAGLAMILTEQPEFIVVDEGSTDLLTAVPPDFPPQTEIIVWAFGWQTPDWLPQAAELALPVILLLHEAAQFAAAWAAGYRMLLQRHVEPEKLWTAVRAAESGLILVDAGLEQVLPATSPTPMDPPEESLTPRELEVLQLLGEGMTNKAIALRLQISEHTVKFHVNAIMSKLAAESRTEAVVKATRLGYILL